MQFVLRTKIHDTHDRLTRTHHTQNFPDISHGYSRVFVMFTKILVGRGKYGFYASWDKKKDNRHRLESEIHNVFPSVWTSNGKNRVVSAHTHINPNQNMHM